MAADALAAAKAYGAAANALKSGGAAAPAAEGPDFGAMVKDAVSGAEGTLRQAESMTAAGAVGQADLVDVVTAVTAAEVTMETVIAVRDEVIRAYQDIMRMPI
jgi:flagellar hook-basal body complex protein FliE